jgi:pimeloyl-ACP methyl ester carboxylesterase
MGRTLLPSVTLSYSPLAGGPAEIHYRQFRTGMPLLFLHGGWGYGIYPLDSQTAVLESAHIIIPDRSGYGRSTKPAIFGLDFHRRAAEETLRFMDALDIDKCVIWGHSDGAVIGVWLGLMAPQRCLGLILEAFHYDRAKPNSRAFFEAMATSPESLGERVSTILAQEHGEDYWRELLREGGQAWLDIARSTGPGHEDLYDGRLSELSVPAVFVHGARDPRTEPGELDRVRHELPAAVMHVIPEGGHSPHSESASAEECGRLVRQALLACQGLVVSSQ